MIFDDDKEILDLCSLILSMEGYEVMTRMNCDNVFDDLKDAQVDVILMDNWMPGRHGSEAIRLLKKNTEYQHIPVILFSANIQTASISEEVGADYFLQKPFDLRSFTDMVALAVVRKKEAAAG
jgi:two-component system alkaline phosphatase synthesis response regulator PhoP